MNIRRSIPMVANRSMALVFSIMLKPLGPIIMPDTINPIRLGTLIFLNITGDIRITSSIIANTNTGLFIGSCVMPLIWSRLRFN
jgi:hypothetical protein